MSKPAGKIGHLRDEELPAVRVIVPPDLSGRVFEDDLAGGNGRADHPEPAGGVRGRPGFGEPSSAWLPGVASSGSLLRHG